jgi:hypothetical protein
MDLFYIIVLSVATVLLILLLTYIGIFMKNAKTSDDGEVFPPVASSCPDYLSSSISDPSSCNIPKNVAGIKNLGSIYKYQVDPATNQPQKNPDGSPMYGAMALDGNSTPGLNSLPPGSIDFKNKDWSKGGTNALCNQKAWANSANVMWDGVSNYNGC